MSSGPAHDDTLDWVVFVAVLAAHVVVILFAIRLAIAITPRTIDPPVAAEVGR